MRRILGVSFEHDRISASVAEVRFGAARHFKSMTAALPADETERAAALTEVLKKWKADYSASGLTAALPLKYFSHHLIDMPAMGRADMRRALEFELEKYLPLPVDEYIFDFAPVAVDQGNKALVFALRRDAVKTLMKAAREADLRILSIRCGAAVSLCGLLEVVGARKKPVNGVFVQMTDEACEMAGLKNSVPLLIKSFSRGIDPGNEIERLLSSYPGQVFFMGPADQSLAERFGARKFQLSIPDAMLSQSQPKHFLNMNFIPEEISAKRADYYPYAVGGLIAATLLLFLLTGVVGHMKDLKALRDVEERRSAIRKQAHGVIEARKKLDLMRNDIKAIDGFVRGCGVVTRSLGELSRTIPDNAWLVNMSIDDKGKIEIEGLGRRTSDLVMALEKSKAFSNVGFSAPVTVKDGEERFSLKMEAEQP